METIAKLIEESLKTVGLLGRLIVDLAAGKISEAEARAEAAAAMADRSNAVAVELEAEYPDTNTGSRVHVASMQERVARNAKDPLVLLLLSVGLLLLIACMNVANLVLARATSRMPEMAVRASIGAGQRRVFRLLLTESLALWLAGGVAGILLARYGVQVVASLMADT